MIGETVYIDGNPVENVLVSASGYNKVGTEGDTDIDRLIGPLADYKLYFPMSYTDDLTGKKVTVRGIECEVLGHPDHEHPDRVFGSWAGQWDMVAAVKRVLPWNKEYLTVRYAAVGRDVMGNRITAEPIVIWQGMAQARQEKETENTMTTGRVAVSTYHFVVPYIQGIYAMDTQRLTVLYRDRIFDVESVEDIDEKRETVALIGVWKDTSRTIHGKQLAATVEPEDESKTFWGHRVSDLQEDLSVADGKITGSLKYVDDGALAHDWGAGYFMALRFIPGADSRSTKVGLLPSEGSGLVELDADRNGVFKVTDKNSQVFKVLSSSGEYSYTQLFDLTGLELR